jgi:hypothetical protein
LMAGEECQISSRRYYRVPVYELSFSQHVKLFTHRNVASSIGLGRKGQVPDIDDCFGL